MHQSQLHEQPPKQSIRTMFRDLLQRVKRSRLFIVLAIFAVFIVAMIEFFIPQAIQYTIDVIIPQQLVDQLIWVFVLVILAALMLIGFQFLGSFLMAIVGQRALYDLRNELYDHLQNLDVAFFDRNRTGDLMSRLTNDVNMLQQLLSSGLLTLLSDLFIFLAISIYMFYVNWQLALLILLTFPILFFVTRFFARRIRSAFRNVQASLAEINNHLQDSFSGIRLVKSFAMENFESERFQERNKTNQEANLKAAKNFSLFGPIVSFINYFGLAIVVAFGAWQTIGGEMTIGMIATFLIYLRLLQNPIRRVSRLMNTIQQAAAAYDRIQSVLSERPQIVSKLDAKTLNVTKGDITFDHVTFSYNDDKQALKQVTFNIAGGKTTALVGKSGSGKTTITNLLTRFYSPDHGTISIDGTPIDHVTLESLRSQISVVSQDIYLVNGTIRENIAYGTPEIDDLAVKKAAAIAKADEFIEELTEGYDTSVGERGIKLSGGQKQRISIARAILKNPQIILLDEATSALDTESEKSIQAGLDDLLRNRTALIIAHRLSTIQNANHIVVLDNGQVVEEGNHEQLLAQKGHYEKLHSLQHEALATI
ncbi:ABC transporter ATP-binding protein [Geomicrobium sediminis]|uniref:Subfamily B ATP-binding cassette protein MsbA n=2 Tax=Geomicrobium TaxID=767528 RepID=A0ABS2PGB4_9BACL|nr:ABC transporter ATP-binding protein [Geomicrobium sediminis]MBM7634475.1 subfamily B ATP-binding cassette protein MsbA [Geomicrobium sediminis]